MDLNLFKEKLVALVKECGVTLKAPISITPTGGYRDQHFSEIGTMDFTGGSLDARRLVHPIDIDIRISTERISSNWNHISGDNRKLHPDLKGK